MPVSMIATTAFAVCPVDKHALSIPEISVVRAYTTALPTNVNVSVDGLKFNICAEADAVAVAPTDKYPTADSNALTVINPVAALLPVMVAPDVNVPETPVKNNRPVPVSTPAMVPAPLPDDEVKVVPAANTPVLAV